MSYFYNPKTNGIADKQNKDGTLWPVVDIAVIEDAIVAGLSIALHESGNAVVVPVERIAYNTTMKGFDAVLWHGQKLDAPHLLVQDHDTAQNWLRDGYAIVDDGEGNAAKGAWSDPTTISPDQYMYNALAIRSAYLRKRGFATLEDAILLADNGEEMRAWARKYNDKVNALHEQISAGTLAVRDALEQLSMEQ